MNLHLNCNIFEALTCSIDSTGTKRLIEVDVGDDKFCITLMRASRRELYTHTVEPAAAATPEECGEIVAKLFAGMMTGSHTRLASPLFTGTKAVCACEEERGGTPLERTAAGRHSHSEELRERLMKSRAILGPEEVRKLMEIERKMFPMRRFAAEDVSERDDGPGPDFAAGWEEYRRQLMETAGCKVPQWDKLPTEVQECWCAGVWATVEGEAAGEQRWGVVEKVLFAQKATEKAKIDLVPSIRRLLPVLAVGRYGLEEMAGLVCGPFEATPVLKVRLHRLLRKYGGMVFGNRIFYVDSISSDAVSYRIEEWGGPPPQRPAAGRHSHGTISAGEGV